MLHRSYQASVILLLLLATHAQSEPASFRSYSLTPHGVLTVAVPSSWNDQMRQPAANMPPTILFTPEHGYDFNVQVTPIWPTKPDAVVPTLEIIAQEVRKAADDAKANSVESTVLLHEIHGSSGDGYYFSVMDRGAKPEEFKYMTQGMVRVGYLMMTFTIVSSDKSGTVVKNALTMLQSARQEFPDP